MRRLEEREKMRQEKERKQRVEEQIYMLRNNLHYKKHCFIDEENEIFVKRKRSASSNLGSDGLDATDKHDCSTPRFKHEEFAAAYKQALERKKKVQDDVALKWQQKYDHRPKINSNSK